MNNTVKKDNAKAVFLMPVSPVSNIGVRFLRMLALSEAFLGISTHYYQKVSLVFVSP